MSKKTFKQTSFLHDKQDQLIKLQGEEKTFWGFTHQSSWHRDTGVMQHQPGEIWAFMCNKTAEDEKAAPPMDFLIELCPPEYKDWDFYCFVHSRGQGFNGYHLQRW